MNILQRLKRLIKSDLNSVMDDLENPKKILEQTIRDMEVQIRIKEENLKSIDHDLKVSFKKQKEVQSKMNTNEENINLAIEEKREDLAKHFIKRKFLLEKSQENLKKEIEFLEERKVLLETDFDKQKKALIDIQDRAEAFALQVKTQENHISNEDFSSSLEHEVELEFLRRMKLN